MSFSVSNMNIVSILAMIKSEDFEYYNADRCVYIQGNSTSELEKQCLSSLGYLPKYTDLVQPQQYGKEHFESVFFIRFFVFYSQTDKLFDHLKLLVATWKSVERRKERKSFFDDDKKLADYR